MAEVKSSLGLRCSDRHVYDFLDTLTALDLLQRDGLLKTAQYSNSASTSYYLDKKKSTYVGGVLELANDRLYGFWGELETALLTGKPQNEFKDSNKDVGDNPYAELFKSPAKVKEFVSAMSGVTANSFKAFAQKFDFSDYDTLTDIGDAGLLSVAVAKHQPHIQCTTFDLPPVEPIAKANISRDLSERIQTSSGNYFESEFPKADVLVMGNVLQDWNEEKKLLLIKKAYKNLPENGAFVAIENVIDDNRNQNSFGLMMSLNQLIETGHGFDYTYSDFKNWATTVGFRKTELIPLASNSSACVAYK